MRCALFFDDSTKQVQAAWYDSDAAASVSLGFSALRAKLRAASSEKECLVLVGNPNRRLREAGDRHGFKEVLFLDPVAAAIREWMTVSEKATSSSVVVLDCDSHARMRWELRVLDPDSQVFMVPADDENGTTRGGFVPAVCGAFDVGLARFVDWFQQHQECSDVILTGAGIENVGLTDELSLLFHWTVFRCKNASVKGAARPPVASKYRVCDEWIIAAEAALHHGRFDMAISALEEAVAVFDVPPGAVEALGVQIREALLSAGDAAAPESAPAYFQKALKVPLPDTVSEDEKDKIHADIYARLARCYCRSGDYGAALEAALAMDLLLPDVSVSDEIFGYIEEHRRKAFKGNSG